MKAGTANSRRPWWVQIGLRFPPFVDLIAPSALGLPPESPVRRRLVKLAFRTAWDGINRGDSEPARLLYEHDAEVVLFGAEGLGLAERYYGELVGPRLSATSSRTSASRDSLPSASATAATA